MHSWHTESLFGVNFYRNHHLSSYETASVGFDQDMEEKNCVCGGGGGGVTVYHLRIVEPI